MDNQNTIPDFGIIAAYSVLILVLMDNQNTRLGSSSRNCSQVLILVLMDNQNTNIFAFVVAIMGLNPCSNG